ncbi:hypothetical protein K8Q94_01155 [Candidatus Nomurabacteria bacterium]|nr:hypothetical protein [Candidatus Nomurabacteria bacterium]
MKIVTVIPLAKGAFKEDLTYFTAHEIPNGNIVSIPIRNKNILGLVVSSEEVTGAKGDIKNMSFNLKKITETKEQSVFKKEFLESAFEVSDYFACRKNNLITHLLPSAFQNDYDKISKINITPDLSSEIRGTELKSEKLLFQNSFTDRISFYKTMIRESFAQKKSIYIVLPTENDINNFNILLSKGVENFTFSIHGGLSVKKQIELFKQITMSEHPVLVLGTAPYLCIPRNDFETIILEHENSNTYKTMNRPSLDLRIFVELFAVKTKAKFILADTVLRFESIARKKDNDIEEIRPLSFIMNNNNAEIVTILREKNMKFTIFSEDILKEIKQNIDKKQNVFIFALRKGLATETICRDCNQSINCEKCHSPVVLYLSKDGTKRRFACNRCNTEKNPEMLCPRCGSWNLIPLGIGTDTVSEELKNIFPDIKIFKLDKESIKNTKEAEEMIQDFENMHGAILIGTEMAFFYLQKPVTFSVVASFDSLWSIPNFRMSEKIIQIIISLILFTKDKLIIQTKNENDSSIIALRNENLHSFVREEIEIRKNLGYPPFKKFIKVTHFGQKEEVAHVKKYLLEIFKEYEPEIFSGFVSKLKDKYVTNMLIKLDPKNWSLPELHPDSKLNKNLLTKLLSLPPSFSVSVDPEDLL